MKEDIFKGKVAAKLAVLEGILKSNNEGKGFFVGDGVRHFKMCLLFKPFYA